jgi:hypothetical protein
MDYFMTLFLSRLCRVQWWDDLWMAQWQEFGRKRSWLHCIADPIWMEGLGKTTENISQNYRCPGWDSNLVPPEYKFRALPMISACSVLALRYLPFSFSLQQKVLTAENEYEQHWTMWHRKLNRLENVVSKSKYRSHSCFVANGRLQAPADWPLWK